MSSAEYIQVPVGVDITTKHGLDLMDLAVETQRFLGMYEVNPDRALSFWNRIKSEFGTRGAGYSPQEFEALSWEADFLVGALRKGTR